MALEDVKAYEVSPVPRGANKRKIFLLKSDGGNSMDELLEKLLKGDFEDEEKIDKALDEFIDSLPEDHKIRKDEDKREETISLIKASLRLQKALQEDLPKDSDLSKVIGDLVVSKVGLTEEEKKKELEKKDLEKKELEKRKHRPGDPGYLKPGRTRKSDDDKELNKQLDKLWKAYDEVIEKNKTLSSLISKERTVRVRKEFEYMAEKEFGKKGDEKVAFAKMLMNAKDSMEEPEYKQLVKTLKADKARIEKGDIFREKGTTRALTKSDDLFDAKVAEIRKTDSKLSKEQAYTKAIDDDPALYEQYLDDHPEQGGYN